MTDRPATTPDEWHLLGEISTGVASFAIIDPAHFADADDAWRASRDDLTSPLWATWAQLPGGGLMIATGDDGGWPVEARFGTVNGEFIMLELRIQFATDDELDPPGPSTPPGDAP